MTLRRASRIYVICLLLAATVNAVVTAKEKNFMQLKNCPDSPNCVSSQSTDLSHRVSPIAFQGDSKQIMATIKQVVLALPRTHVVEENESYLHIEFRSQLFNFTDDVEIFIDRAGQQIHIRSASRTGYWDFGANRKRVEKIRADFHKIISGE